MGFLDKAPEAKLHPKTTFLKASSPCLGCPRSKNAEQALEKSSSLCSLQGGLVLHKWRILKTGIFKRHTWVEWSICFMKIALATGQALAARNQQSPDWCSVPKHHHSPRASSLGQESKLTIQQESYEIWWKLVETSYLSSTFQQKLTHLGN